VRWLLIRRNRKTGELAFYRCFMPTRCRWPPWWGRRVALDRRGALPDRQGPGRPGSAPGSPLALLVPLGQVAMLAHAFLVAMALTDQLAILRRPGWRKNLEL
jgi:hypothetical protein